MLFETEKWINLSINIHSFVKHCYTSKTSSFNFKSLDQILIKGNILVRKIFTMNNSLADTDGYADPDAYKIDEIPKSINYTAAVSYCAQVITASRVGEVNNESATDIETTSENTTFQSENRTGYKYAFGSRVK
jgi:hypothetical protein